MYACCWTNRLALIFVNEQVYELDLKQIAFNEAIPNTQQQLSVCNTLKENSVLRCSCTYMWLLCWYFYIIIQKNTHKTAAKMFSITNTMGFSFFVFTVFCWKWQKSQNGFEPLWTGCCRMSIVSHKTLQNPKIPSVYWLKDTTTLFIYGTEESPEALLCH